MRPGCWVGEFRIATQRLVLREWRDADAGAMHAMGRDPRVMEFLGPLEDSDDARALVDGQMVNQSLFGHCFWPVERRSDGRLLGFCGLNPGPEATPLEGGIEIGWRLASDTWGRGYAGEAARACLAWGWAHLDAADIAAITVAANMRSRRVMDRIGMTRRPGQDFAHPVLAPGNPLAAHIVYRIARPG